MAHEESIVICSHCDKGYCDICDRFGCPFCGSKHITGTKPRKREYWMKSDFGTHPLTGIPQEPELW